VNAKLTTAAARPGSSTYVTFLMTTDLPSRSNERIGSSSGSSSTCASERSRYRPGPTISNQHGRFSLPRIHCTKSENCFGIVMRPYPSPVTCSGVNFGTTIFYHFTEFYQDLLGKADSIFSTLAELPLTFYRVLPHTTSTWISQTPSPRYGIADADLLMICRMIDVGEGNTNIGLPGPFRKECANGLADTSSW
jgi:hypothetical protein